MVGMSAGEVQVRPARAEDVPQVLPMADRHYAFHEAMDAAVYLLAPGALERYGRWLRERAADPEAVFLVAEDGDRLVGFLIGNVVGGPPIYRIQRFGFIHDVWVEASHRRRGVARGLVRAALDRFGAIGVPQVRLETAAPNDAARALFTSLGFRPSVIHMLREMNGGAQPA